MARLTAIALTSAPTEIPARTAGGPAAVLLAAGPALPWGQSTVLDRLRDQLVALGVADVMVIPPDGAALAELAARGDGPLLIAAGDVIVSSDALAGLLAGPTAVLTGARSEQPEVALSHARVIGAASGYHRVARASAASLGLLKVAAQDRGALAAIAARLPAAPGDLVALLLVGLVRAGLPVRAADVREHFWARPGSDAELEAAALAHAGHDPERARLDSAVKASDGFFTTFFVSPYSKHIARWAGRRGLSPNLVTVASLGLGLLAAAAFATGDRADLVAGAVLVQLAFAADCADGQLARYTRNFSAFGAWLDSVCDRLKEYAIYAGLAIGGGAWQLAAAALALQTCRHVLELSWTSEQLRALDAATHPPLEVAEDPVRGVLAPGRDPLTWLKKAIAFPIGERFAVISVTAAVSGAQLTFGVLLIWGGVAAAYSVGGRLLRSLG